MRKSLWAHFQLKNPFGRRGEARAEQFLRKEGYRIVARNVTNPDGRRLGEIDIVAFDGDCLVFVEVKARTSTEIPLALAIRKEKLHRLAKIGEWYLRRMKLFGTQYRFDMVGVLKVPGQEPKITHIKDIFL